MKDDFLRNHRELPRREFSERLYKKLARDKSRAAAITWKFLVWGVAAVFLFTGISYNASRLDTLKGPIETPPTKSEVAVQRVVPPMMLIDREKDSAEVHYQASDGADQLGPFDSLVSITVRQVESQMIYVDPSHLLDRQ